MYAGRGTLTVITHVQWRSQVSVLEGGGSIIFYSESVNLFALCLHHQVNIYFMVYIMGGANVSSAPHLAMRATYVLIRVVTLSYEAQVGLSQQIM